MENNKRLHRSSTDYWLAGVLGGVAEYFGWDPAIVRLIYVLATFFTCFSGVIVYIVLWICMPKY